MSAKEAHPERIQAFPTLQSLQSYKVVPANYNEFPEYQDEAKMLGDSANLKLSA